MAYTMQQVVDKGRIPLNDADKARYSDLQLLGFAIDALLLLLNTRPDLFFGQFTSLPTITALTNGFPLPDTLAPAVADYVTARAESMNDESVLEQRAAAFFALFKGQV